MPKQPPGTARRDARPALDSRAQGLRAFQAGRYDQAIALWAPLRADPTVRVALAEAYFRHALAAAAPDQRADALRLAVAASPDDARLHFHLGMAMHRQGDLPAAAEHYAVAASARPAPRGLPLLRALLAIEQGRPDDPAVAALADAERRLLAGALDLLRGALPAASPGDPLASFWRGLGLLSKGDPAAAEALAAAAAVPPALSPLRRYYSGLAAALAGDVAGALAAWAKAPRERYATPWRFENEAAALFARIGELLAAGERAAAAEVAAEVVGTPWLSAALSELAVGTLDEAARDAARAGEWAQAARWWSAARAIVAGADGLGSPRPLLHNLALAHEAQEHWIEAAESWRAMLRTRPRRGAKAAGGLTDDQWAWVRRRVLTCYQKANEPGLAVEVYRQALKAEPDDLDLRLELSDALLANDQPQAAANELRRIRERDPGHVEAQARLVGIYLAENRWWDADGALKQLARQNPEGERERKLVAHLHSQLGGQYNEFGSYEQAYRVFGEAARFDPAQYVHQINLARAAFNMRRKKDAVGHVERALELGAAAPEAYVAAIGCWAVEGDIKQARAVIARAEQALSPDFHFYINAGVELVGGSAPPQAALFNPFGPPRKPEARDDEWTRLATALFDKALAQRPDDAALREAIAAELLQVEPALALRYAGEAVLIAPADARAQMLKGLLQGLVGDKKAAKETLRQAIKLAKQQGLKELADNAEQLRREVDSPFFSMALQMGSMFEELDLDDDEDW